jgi:hypothetical protein
MDQGNVIYIYIYIYIYICLCMCVCLCVYGCVYIYIYIHINVYIHIYIMEYYSAISNDITTCGLDKLEDIMLTEVSKAQKQNGHMFSLILERLILKMNKYTKTSMIICKFICRTCL